MVSNIFSCEFFLHVNYICTVWHGTQERYQDFDKLAGRFVSEFGMEAFPDIRTINSFLPQDSTERYPQSRTIDFHNKADGHERRIALYVKAAKFKLGLEN